MEKRADEQEILIEKQKRQGSISNVNTEEMAEDLAYIEQMRATVSGGKAEHIFADTEKADLTAETLMRHKAGYERYVRSTVRDLAKLESSMPSETFAVANSLFHPSFGFSIPVYKGRTFQQIFTPGSMRECAMLQTVQGNTASLMYVSGKCTVTIDNQVSDLSDMGEIPELSEMAYRIVDWAVNFPINRNAITDSTYPIVSWITEQGAMARSEAEAKAHIQGTGAVKGLIGGVKKAAGKTTPNMTEEPFGTVRVFKSGTNGKISSPNKGDAGYAFNVVNNALHSLHPRFRPNAKIIMARTTQALFSQLTNEDGTYFMEMNKNGTGSAYDTRYSDHTQ